MSFVTRSVKMSRMLRNALACNGRLHVEGNLIFFITYLGSIFSKRVTVRMTKQLATPLLMNGRAVNKKTAAMALTTTADQP